MTQNVKLAEATDIDNATEITRKGLRRLTLLREAFLMYSQSDCQDLTRAFWEGMSGMCTDIFMDLNRLSEILANRTEKEKPFNSEADSMFRAA
jgi:hypothetical protein